MSDWHIEVGGSGSMPNVECVVSLSAASARGSRPVPSVKFGRGHEAPGNWKELFGARLDAALGTVFTERTVCHSIAVVLYDDGTYQIDTVREVNAQQHGMSVEGLAHALMAAAENS